MTTKNAPQTSFQLGDRPIKNSDEDRLGYGPFAEMLATSVLRGIPADGLVVGIYGAWGLGKSSLLKLIEDEVRKDDETDDKAIIVQFNPWWFSGRDDLTLKFLETFAAATQKTPIAKAAMDFVRQYRDMFRPVARLALDAAAPGLGTVTTTVLGFAGQVLDNSLPGAPESPTVPSLKRDLSLALQKSAVRILVLIDDVDRLLPEEMLEVFRFVKAVGDLPNVIYVLAFDDNAAVRALDSKYDKDFGRGYLEKIVQVQFNLPIPRPGRLLQLFANGLEPLLVRVPNELKDQARLERLLQRGIGPLLRTPRDGVRLLNALSVTLPAVEHELNAADFLALEALRILLPDVYKKLANSSEDIVGNGLAVRAAQRKPAHAEWVEDLAGNSGSVREIVELLFPGMSRGNPAFGNRRDEHNARICAAKHFHKYFHYQLDAEEMSRVEFATLQVAVDCEQAVRALRQLVAEKRCRQFLEMLAGQLISGTPVQSPITWIEALAEVGEEVLDAGREALLSEHFLLIELVIKLIQRLPTERYASAIRAMEKAGISTCTRLVWGLSGEHGRLGEEADSPDDRALTEEEALRLESIAVERIRKMTSEELLQRPDAMRILHFWRHVDEEGVRARVAAVVDGDLLTPLIEKALGISFIATHEVPLDSMRKLFDLPALNERIETVLTFGNVEGDERGMLIAVSTAIAAEASANG